MVRGTEGERKQDPVPGPWNTERGQKSLAVPWGGQPVLCLRSALPPQGWFLPLIQASAPMPPPPGGLP